MNVPPPCNSRVYPCYGPYDLLGGRVLSIAIPAFVVSGMGFKEEGRQVKQLFQALVDIPFSFVQQ